MFNLEPDEIPDAVLFCCTLNSIRSPMAEGLLKAHVGTRIYVDSAGVRPADPNGFMIEAMQQLDIDMSGHNAKSFDELEDTSFDLIIALSPEAQHHAVEMTRTMACDVEFWNTFDPSIIEGSRDQQMAAFIQVRDQLIAKITKRFPEDKL
jgi:protein-tyrosine-phosphatase